MLLLIEEHVPRGSYEMLLFIEEHAPRVSC